GVQTAALEHVGTVHAGSGNFDEHVVGADAGHGFVGELKDVGLTEMGQTGNSHQKSLRSTVIVTHHLALTVRVVRVALRFLATEPITGRTGLARVTHEESAALSSTHKGEASCSKGLAFEEKSSRPWRCLFWCSCSRPATSRSPQ